MSRKVPVFLFTDTHSDMAMLQSHSFELDWRDGKECLRADNATVGYGLWDKEGTKCGAVVLVPKTAFATSGDSPGTQLLAGAQSVLIAVIEQTRQWLGHAQSADHLVVCDESSPLFTAASTLFTNFEAFDPARQFPYMYDPCGESCVTTTPLPHVTLTRHGTPLLELNCAAVAKCAALKSLLDSDEYGVVVVELPAPVAECLTAASVHLLQTYFDTLSYASMRATSDDLLGSVRVASWLDCSEFEYVSMCRLTDLWLDCLMSDGTVAAPSVVTPASGGAAHTLYSDTVVEFGNAHCGEDVDWTVTERLFKDTYGSCAAGRLPWPVMKMLLEMHNNKRYRIEHMRPMSGSWNVSMHVQMSCGTVVQRRYQTRSQFHLFLGDTDVLAMPTQFPNKYNMVVLTRSMDEPVGAELVRFSVLVCVHNFKHPTIVKLILCGTSSSSSSSTTTTTTTTTRTGAPRLIEATIRTPASFHDTSKATILFAHPMRLRDNQLVVIVCFERLDVASDGCRKFLRQVFAWRPARGYTLEPMGGNIWVFENVRLSKFIAVDDKNVLLAEITELAPRTFNMFFSVDDTGRLQATYYHLFDRMPRSNTRTSMQQGFVRVLSGGKRLVRDTLSKLKVHRLVHNDDGRVRALHAQHKLARVAGNNVTVQGATDSELLLLVKSSTQITRVDVDQPRQDAQVLLRLEKSCSTGLLPTIRGVIVDQLAQCYRVVLIKDGPKIHSVRTGVIAIPFGAHWSAQLVDRFANLQPPHLLSIMVTRMHNRFIRNSIVCIL